MPSSPYHAICIGAGPAGLTAAYLLAKAGKSVLVLEKDPQYFGGISRTEEYKRYLCDIGGHRFFSKSDAVNALWDEILEDDFILRPRKSRIYYNGKFFDYPLKAMDALVKLGVFESARCMGSYAKAALFPVKNPKNFEEWVSNQFGHRLFSIFFKTYTEKVWGMRCNEISADWAAQRIKGLSLGKAVMNAVLPQRRGRQGDALVKTLIDRFRYPRKGPGMMWDAAAEKTERLGGKVLKGYDAVQCRYEGGRWFVDARRHGGETETFEAEHVISTMPLSRLVRSLAPKASPQALQAADSLRYRDFLIVGLVVKDRQVFDDNWIYIHEPGVKVGRIQNFKSWSPEMVPEAGTNCYGMEYFCFEGDGLWTMDDGALVELAKGELAALNLAEKGDVLEGFVIRQKKAYPVYDADYKRHVAAIAEELARYPNLHTVGRNGMHRYNNQDHSMMTAMLTVENILAGKALWNPWNVNEDAEYHEEVKEASAGRAVPQAVS